jgi:hypothetical protein
MVYNAFGRAGDTQEREVNNKIEGRKRKFDERKTSFTRSGIKVSKNCKFQDQTRKSVGETSNRCCTAG